MVMTDSAQQSALGIGAAERPRPEPLKHMVQSVLSDVTPVRLRLWLVGNAILVVAFTLISLLTVAQHKHAIQTIGFDAAPSVIAAHQISVSVEQLSADLAEQLLVGDDRAEAARLQKDSDRQKELIAKQLVAAAKNITYGQAEQQPIENIQIAYGQLLTIAQSALDARSGGNSATALSGFRNLMALVERQILPNVDSLNKANSDALESTYDNEASGSSLSCGLVLLVGLLLMGSLFTTQIYLSQKFRRRLNIPLLIATVCVGLFVQHIYTSLRHSGEFLRVAKEDSYNSISVLLDARANAYLATLSQACFLLDRSDASAYEKLYNDTTDKIAHFGIGHDANATIAAAEKQIGSNEKVALPGMTGLLAQEMNNIRFAGEGDAALDALKEYVAYSEIDSKMRQAESSGDYEGARRLGLGYTPDAGKYSFSRFDDALLRTLRINQERFYTSIKSGLDELSGLILLSFCLMLLVLISTYFGLKPRMAEYVH